MNALIQRLPGHKIAVSCITCPSMLDRVQFIQGSPLGIGMTEQECFDLCSRARLKMYRRGDPMFMQGEPGLNLFLLRSGQVKLTQVSPGGNEVLLWVCGEASVLGIMSAMNSRPYSCSAHALMPCTAWAWDQPAISYIMNNSSRLMQNMTIILSNRVQELEERFRELATENVRKRLALALLRLSGAIGRLGPRGIEIALSRREIAQMTGTTLFSISRTLSLWARRKLVLVGRGSVVIPDLSLIESMACEE
jgi:CRP/FNR family transcriptional regulator, nitrogen oxide reductase regulator